MQILLLIPILLFPALMLAAALKDVTSYTIPNWISLTLVAVFPFAAFAAHLPLMAVGLAFTCGLAGLIAGMAMFALRWIGGGDAKLLAAAALWLSWPAAPTFLIITSLAGGVLTLIILGLRSDWARPYLPVGPAWFQHLMEPKGALPYGVAIAAGALAAFPASGAASALGLFGLGL
ncbi:MAG: pilus assembly protein CpaA [Caulobacteraceae bacterium]|nr:pilus assembly protein CpaA [Caulobacteraceae bacterium]